MKTTNPFWTVGGVIAVLLLAAGVARGQMGVTLWVGNPVAVTNALGRNLPGSRGVTSGASRVEIRRWGGGIQPPNPETHEGNEIANPLIQVSCMGKNVLGSDPGMFSEGFADRLGTNGTCFARVYDAETPQGALYYADSVPFTAPADPNTTTLDVTFGPLKLVNGEEDVDTDGDGIPDAMENERTGTIASEWDSDRDGWDDRFEVLNDTLDPNESRPIDVWIQPPQVAEDPTTVGWWALPGVAYRLEFHPDQVDATNYVEVAAGAASSTEKVEEVDWVLDESPMGFFRVKAFPYGMP